MRHTHWVFVFLLLAIVLPSGVVAGEPGGEPAVVAPGAVEETIYRVSPDPRLCISPVCGGAWVSAVNQQLTVCADGQQRETCYVATVEDGGPRPLGGPSLRPFGAAPLLVRGRIEPRD